MTDFSNMDDARNAWNGKGAELLDEVEAAIRKYVVMPSEETITAMVLHAAATHGQPAWEVAPRFIWRAPEKQCGKTRAQTIHRFLSHRPIATVNISAAAMARIIGEEDPPTLHMDEYDTIFGKGKSGDRSEDLRGIINSGHQRGQTYTRWDPMGGGRLEEIPTFCMVTLAGIDRLPDTIEDRSVAADMRRRIHTEHVSPFRLRRDKPPLEKLAGQLNAWVRGSLNELREAEPDMPVDDRDADTWECLVAIADIAGGGWSERARESCVTLCSGKKRDAELRLNEELLRDLHIIFGDDDQMSTADIMSRLARLEEAPWSERRPEFSRDGFTATDMAKFLKGYGVTSTKLRIGSTTPRGYRRVDLEDAWLRNCKCERCSMRVPPPQR